MQYKMILPIALGAATLCAGARLAAAADNTEASAEQPFTFFLTVGASHEDNVLRLENENEARSLLGTSDMADWYRFFGAGFHGLIAREKQRFDLRGEVQHRTYDRLSQFDHTSGRFRGAWHWRAGEKTRGDIGYRFRRELRSFSNQSIPTKDLAEESAVFASVERQIAQRWLLRLAAESADLTFSASPLLQKQRSTVETELRYAASQQSTFGLLTTYTQSTFDQDDRQDFSGWSVGPLVRWRPQSNLTIAANLAYTHQGLDVAQPGIDEFDGITGFVSANIEISSSVGVILRGFRDISDLGGEIPLYTVRNGVSIAPTWQITSKVTGRAQLELQYREFNAASVFGEDREDDYSHSELWLDFAVAPRWLISIGVGAEHRDSNVDSRDFDDVTVHANIRFNL